MEYAVSVGIVVGVSIVLALSLNLITGYCGQISLGHAAFYGVGAYTSTVLTKAGLPFEVGLLGAMIVAGGFGVLVGVASLRVREDFLAITTMGAGFVFLGIVRKQQWLGGELGIHGIPSPGFSKPTYLVLVLCCAAAVALLSIYLKRSWAGHAYSAIADDEDTARMVGINVARYKLTAFAIGTAIAGLAGSLYAHDIRYIGPDSFGFTESITILSMVVVGGIGSVWGVVAAAVILSALPQILQVVAEYKLLLYGGLLFFMMRYAPDGLAGLTMSSFKAVKQMMSGGSRERLADR